MQRKKKQEKSYLVTIVGNILLVGIGFALLMLLTCIGLTVLTIINDVSILQGMIT